MSIPATLKRRRTAFSPNVANYASRRTALFIATFGSCDVMPCYHRKKGKRNEEKWCLAQFLDSEWKNICERKGTQQQKRDKET